MTVYLFSRCYEIGQILNDHLLSKGYSCFLFSNKNDLVTAVTNLKVLPDLLILDYQTFNHDFFNIYQHLYEIKMYLPIIFYNDPCMMPCTRALVWLDQLNLLKVLLDKKYKENEKNEYKKLFEEIEYLVELDELKPYISLMQQPKPLPDCLKKKQFTLDYIKNCNTNFIYKFKENVKLPDRLFYLLKIFQQNIDSPITLKDIQEIYRKDGKEITENSLKTLISNLRKEMLKDKTCNFLISNNKGAYSFIEIK